MIGDTQLSRFSGTWTGSEELFATAWTAAGHADAVITIACGPNDSLLLDYQEWRDAATLTGHGVVAAGAWWWFDSYG